MKEIKIINKEDKDYPQKLLQIKNPPKQLYVLGDESLLNKQSIAIVGSRDCTQYGHEQAKRFAKELAKENICIVSGMAIGIDGAAHIGAKGEIGKTIAVLGCGFNHIFPEENEDLFYEILEEGGCIISEYEPDVEPNSKYFPIRNRIVSGLSDGVLVVEAKKKSGSGITARLAKEQNKKVYCIPSNIDSKNGIGTGMLIQSGAKLVLTPEDILVDLGKNVTKNEIVEEVHVEVEEQYKEVYETLTRVPLNVNEICKRTRKNIIEVNTTLTMLELQGLVRQVGANEFIRM